MFSQAVMPVSAYEIFHFTFGILLACVQPILLYRAWHRLLIGEFLFVFVVDQFLLLHFFFLPPKAKLPKPEEKREVIATSPMEEDIVKPIEKRWSKEELQSLQAALQQMNLTLIQQ